jgi:cytochrome c556
MSKSNRKFVVMLTACMLVGASVAIAQSGAIEIIHLRQQGLKDMGASLKTVRDQLRQSAPDMTAIKVAGENIKATANKMTTWFPQGSGVEAGIKTAAKSEIWSDAATFDKKRSDLIAAAEEFAKLTAAGDKTAIAAAVSPLSRTCKGCHDLFFEDDK